jgi:predicted dehydrogenase
MQHHYTACWDLLGSTGRMTLAHGAYSPPADHVPVLRLHNGEGAQELRLNPHDQVRTAVTRFADAVRGGSPAVDGEAERAQARLVDEIRRLARITEL